VPNVLYLLYYIENSPLYSNFVLHRMPAGVRECYSCFGLTTYGFFHQTMPSGPLIHGLKPFRIWLRICKVNRQKVVASAVSMTPLRPHQRIQLCKLGTKSRGLSGVNDTAEAGDLEFERQFCILKPLQSIL
jgi:hypothetical protein